MFGAEVVVKVTRSSHKVGKLAQLYNGLIIVSKLSPIFFQFMNIIAD